MYITAGTFYIITAVSWSILQVGRSQKFGAIFGAKKEVGVQFKFRTWTFSVKSKCINGVQYTRPAPLLLLLLRLLLNKCHVNIHNSVYISQFFSPMRFLPVNALKVKTATGHILISSTVMSYMED